MSDSVPSKSDSLSPTGAHRIARPQPSLLFVDKRYHLPVLSQAALATAAADEGLSVYLVPLWGLWDDAWVGARVG